MKIVLKKINFEWDKGNDAVRAHHQRKTANHRI